MEKILRTDSAYQAIDKINANFEEGGGGSGDVLAKGNLVGDGTNFVFAYFNATPGSLIHIDFGGNWGDVGGTSYNKVAVGYRDDELNYHALLLIPCGQTINDDGCEVIMSTGYADEVHDMYLAVRAPSGTAVPYTISSRNPAMRVYYAEEMADTVRKVKDRQKNDNCLTFTMATDIHYRDGQAGPFINPCAAISMGENMAEFANLVRLDNVVCLGDVIDGTKTAKQSMSEIGDIIRIFGWVKYPLVFAVGNHDDNRYYSSGVGERMFTQQEVVANIVAPVDERTSIGGAMAGCNYFRDVERNKVRIIVLIGGDFNGNYNFTSTTQTWLSETLASMPDGYKAIILTHIPPVRSHCWDNTQYQGGAEIASIIQGAGDKVICVFQGHTHLDNTFMSPYVAVMTSSQKCYVLSNLSGAPEDSVFPTRTGYDYREDLWNAVVVDLDNKIINVIRFGAGVDRYIHYTPISVSSGGSTTLTPSVITATAWHVRDSESSSISVSSGTVTVASGATSGSRLSVRAADADGNFEFWSIKVV